MSRSKKRARIRAYVRIGRRLATLGAQGELAKVLGLTQQTVSRKLRGESAILLSDLETLARKYRKPMTWFFEGYGRADLPSDMVSAGRGQ